ncbi:HNH endonuclease [Microbispora sp. ATCC PTA-5024]|uniref:HNH endonuclease n=1 Tax=Microbispora sp. ATCC PTA-5024 TaxID=316330 RepID=UPI0003DBC29E|nr:hypothetical protein [Microbispora sp. ATCC PTA-5024]ETK36174.1 hypothetical protein MPTA5024_11145 [Microbispora sp. ATCC PTA-5024]
MSVSDKVRKLVLERDNHSCVCCGRSIIGQPYSLQHRRARKMGGSRLPWIDQPQNLITVYGSATTGCHARMESRGQADKSRGYVIPAWPEIDPRFIPVQVVTEFGPARVWLTPEGGLSNDPPADAPPAECGLHLVTDACPACLVCRLCGPCECELVAGWAREAS